MYISCMHKLHILHLKILMQNLIGFYGRTLAVYNGEGNGTPKPVLSGREGRLVHSTMFTSSLVSNYWARDFRRPLLGGVAEEAMIFFITCGSGMGGASVFSNSVSFWCRSPPNTVLVRGLQIIPLGGRPPIPLSRASCLAAAVRSPSVMPEDFLAMWSRKISGIWIGCAFSYLLTNGSVSGPNESKPSSFGFSSGSTSLVSFAPLSPVGPFWTLPCIKTCTWATYLQFQLIVSNVTI